MATSNGGRIGKVKFKNGAEVVVLENRRTGNPVLIALLIDLLDRARSGDLVAFGMITVNPKGTVGTAWSYGGDGSHHHELASGALTLAHRIGSS